MNFEVDDENGNKHFPVDSSENTTVSGNTNIIGTTTLSGKTVVGHITANTKGVSSNLSVTDIHTTGAITLRKYYVK